MYEKIGYINSDQACTFLQFLRKSFMEKIVMGGQVKLGEGLRRACKFSESDIGFIQIDPITIRPYL